LLFTPKSSISMFNILLRHNYNKVAKLFLKIFRRTIKVCSVSHNIQVVTEYDRWADVASFVLLCRHINK